MDIIGDNLINLTNNTEISVWYPCYSPCWSEDGSYIAFQSLVKTTSTISNYEICIVDSGDQNLCEVTHSLSFNTHPSWYPGKCNKQDYHLIEESRLD